MVDELTSNVQPNISKISPGLKRSRYLWFYFSQRFLYSGHSRKKNVRDSTRRMVSIMMLKETKFQDRKV